MARNSGKKVYFVTVVAAYLPKGSVGKNIFSF